MGGVGILTETDESGTIAPHEAKTITQIEVFASAEDVVLLLASLMPCVEASMSERLDHCRREPPSVLRDVMRTEIDLPGE